MTWVDVVRWYFWSSFTAIVCYFALFGAGELRVWFRKRRRNAARCHQWHPSR